MKKYLLLVRGINGEPTPYEIFDDEEEAVAMMECVCNAIGVKEIDVEGKK